MKVTLGGDRLGSGSKMQVELHNYERSTHDLSYLWRSTMAAGTLVPFLSEVALPGDTFDIDLDCDIKTHPTIGPLFGSYKVQLDVFCTPIRLYNSLLHNNMLGIGLNMERVKLPTIALTALLPAGGVLTDGADIDNIQINPSSLLKYIGISGIGLVASPVEPQTRTFNGTQILNYYDIYKNYYANKQEEYGAVLHTPGVSIIETVDEIKIFTAGVETTVPEAPSAGTVPAVLGSQIRIYYTGAIPLPEQILMFALPHGVHSAQEYGALGPWTDTGTYIWAPYRQTYWGDATFTQWQYTSATDINTGAPGIATFPLSNIDEMRLAILAHQSITIPFEIGDNSTTGGNIDPYTWLNEQPNGIPNILSSQEGLALKTYQSDLFNNWLQTEWIDGTTGINAITAIDTSSGSFTIDQLNISKKVYDMLNRVAVSGGSYKDWINAVYVQEGHFAPENPMYMGGMIRELVFQEVVSNTAAETATDGPQPLGTLAGKGVMGGKQKGGHVTIKVDEPSYIMGIISLTPRIDYSQGNKWDVHLQTLDDFHKPALDEIGFQELITEQMAWWDTVYSSGWQTKSAGKQPAWINYMTNVNRTYGNFAIRDNEMFMTLNRRYEYGTNGPWTPDGPQLRDLTTYIDPSKYNFIFAETALDAQNFWAQIAVDIIARRKMSARVMPNI